MLRDAVYDTVLLKQRCLYHSHIAAWIEANAGERLEEHLALVAGHHADGGQPDQAADWFIRAGERAASQGSPQTARHLFEQALKHIHPNDLQRRWRALLGHDEVLGTLGELTNRQSDDATLLSLAQQLGDDSRLAAAYFHIGTQAYNEGNDAAALEAFHQALQAAQRAGDLRMQALILPMQVFNLTRQGDFEAASALVGQAMEIANQTGDAEILARALTNVSHYYWSIGDVGRGVQLLQQQVDINQQQGNRLGEVIGLINLGYQHLSLGQFETGRNLLERALQSARNMRARRCVAYCLLNLGLAEWRLEQPQAACQTLQFSLVELEPLGDQLGLASRQFYLGLALEKAGQISDAAAKFEAARAAFEQLGASPRVVEAQAGLARLALQSSNLPLAEQTAMQIMAYLDQHGPQGLELPMLTYLTCVRVFQALGDEKRLAHILENGRSELQARLNQISDAVWRQNFLEAVPEHRELVKIRTKY